MDAVAALYDTGRHELSEEIVASLGRSIFGGNDLKPATWVHQGLAKISYRALKWTTKSAVVEDASGAKVTVFSNKLMERSGHPYARSLLDSSRSDISKLVEGGDPMNANYMMLAPEIRSSCGLWDKLFLDSVQGKDVRLRLALETRAMYEEAARRLQKKAPVRLKAVAAGTGLSLILAYDRLIRDGFSPDLISATITDREEANIEKCNRLLDSLATTRENRRSGRLGCGIAAETEDIFWESLHPDAAKIEPHDVVTAIGILEYFQGFSYSTSGQRLKIAAPVDSATAHDLVVVLYRMLTESGSLIVNTMRNHPSTRILELFGRRFVYRAREDLQALLASVNFRPERLVGSGNIYDVEVYRKKQKTEDAGEAQSRK
ncbi:MAG TPA: hypothetical protein VJ719_08080 [Chthoniobacterales bacterium]|nr:hypothetical protein [Chthoniobacterales bacterium]